MSRIEEIEEAVRSLSEREQRELLQNLTRQLGEEARERRALPLVPATGKHFSQVEIDDALDAD